VRFDPEDYAFVAHYDDRRIAGLVKGLGRQGVMRLVSVAISIVVVILIASTSGVLHPTVWYRTTRLTVIILAISLALTIVAQVVDMVASKGTSLGVHVAMLGLLIVAAGVLLVPLWYLVKLVKNYAELLQSFISVIDKLPGQPGLDSVQPALTGVRATSTTLLVLLIVAAAGLLAAAVVAALWLTKPRSLGWGQRRVMQVALMVPGVLLLACGAGVVFVAKYLVPQIEKKLGLTNLPVDITLPVLDVFNDWLIWLLLAGLVITLLTFATGAFKLVTANILRCRVPVGNALRVDPLGLVIDDLRGPRRVTWTEQPAIAGRQRSNVPGPELVVGGQRQPPWQVPFMYLDVLPGTIDSAVRAATQNARTLNLAPLDRMF